MTQENMQEHIRRLQALYRQWTVLYDELQALESRWQEGAELLRELNAFYFDGAYRDYHARIEAGESIDLTTDGEYSIMSEDALWNAFQDWQQLAWQRLRNAVAVLDPRNEKQPENDKNTP